MDLALINAFLASTDLTESETLLRNNAMNLNAALTKAAGERDQLFKSLKSREEEVLKLSGALENQLAMIESLAKQKGLQPLEPPREQPTETTE